MPDYARVAHFHLIRKVIRIALMDYQSLVKHTEVKIGAFLDRRINELLDTTYRQDLEALAEKICFQNLIAQYRRRKLPIPIHLEKRLLHEATQRRTAKIERRTSHTAEGEAGGLLPEAQRVHEDSRNSSD